MARKTPMSLVEVGFITLIMPSKKALQLAALLEGVHEASLAYGASVRGPKTVTVRAHEVFCQICNIPEAVIVVEDADGSEGDE